MFKPRGLFDEQERLEKLSRKQDPLKRLSAHIDFEYFRKPLEQFFAKDKADSTKGGRPAYDCVTMFKILILQRYYNVSDDAMEYAILDRLSFMPFPGLRINDVVPDAKTIWLFRDQLTTGKLTEKLFAHLDKLLDKDGMIEQQKRNRKKSKWRVRVEHIFGFMTNTMNGMYLHYRSLLRNAAAIALINLTYNLFRLVQMKVVVSN